MRTHWLPCLTVAALFAAPALAHAGDDQLKPAIVVRVRSLATVDRGLHLMSCLTGNHLAGQWLAAKHLTSLKDLKGVDAKRPLGMYVFSNKLLDASQPPDVLMIPVSDEKQFVETLRTLGLDVRPGTDDHLYILKAKGVSKQGDLRVANGYGYFALSGPGLVARDRVLSPKVLFLPNQKAALSVTMHLDRFPEQARERIVNTFMLRGLGQSMCPESHTQTGLWAETHQKFRQLFGDELRHCFASLVNDGKELDAELDAGPGQHGLQVNVTLTPKAGTRLAEMLAKMDKTTSTVPGLFKADAAAAGMVSFTLSKRLRKAVNPVLEAAAKKARAKLKEGDPKEEVGDLLLSLAPAVSTRHINGAFVLRGPDKAGRYTLVAARAMKSPAKVKKTVDALVRALPEAEKAKFKYGVDQSGTVGIHRLDLGQALPKECQEVFGTGPMYVAYRPDALFLAVGDDALKSLREALQAPTGPAEPMHFELSLRRLAELRAKEHPGLEKKLDQLFGPNGEGKIRCRLQGGEALRLRIHLDPSAVRAFAVQAQRAAGRRQEPAEAVSVLSWEAPNNNFQE